MLPRTLRNFQITIDGRGYAGRATEFTPPTLSIQTEDFRAGGMDMPAQIDMGMEALELSFTLAEYDPDVLRLFGLHDQNAVRLTARGALQRNGEAAVAIVINATGHIKEFDPGSRLVLLPGCVHRLELDGGVIHEVDVENMIRVINGVDQLRSQRTAIGI